MTFDSVLSAIASALGHGIWGGLLILLVAFATLKILELGQGANAATRHRVWLAALIGIFVLHVALAWAAWPTSKTASLPELPDATNETMGVEVTPVAPVETDLSVAEDVSTSAMVEPATAVSPTSLEIPASAAPFVLIGGILWLVGLALGTSRLAVAVLRVRKLKGHATPLDPEILVRVGARASGARRRFDLARCEISSPVAAGYFRPAVLIPADLVVKADEETFDQLVLHEVAHLERRDDWTMLMQRAIEALLWFNPAVWVVGRQLAKEREMACDEWVVASTRQPERYVKSLGELIKLRLDAAGLMASPGLAARESDLMARVRRLLDQGISVSSTPSRERTAVAVALIALAATVLVLKTPSFSLNEWRASTEWGSSSVEPPVQQVSLEVPAPPPVPTPLAAPTETPESEPSIPETLAEPETAPEATEDVERPLPTATIPTRPLELAPLDLSEVPAGVGPTEEAPSTDPISMVEDLTIRGWLRLLRVAKGIASSGDRARFLLEASGRLPDDDTVHAAFLETAASISSSSERYRVLMTYLGSQDLSKNMYIKLLDAVGSISSSGTRARALMTIAAKMPADEAVEDAFLDAAENISSSSDRERVLRALLRGSQN